MAKLIINGDLTIVPPKVVKALRNRSLCVEDIATRCATTNDVVRSTLSKMRAKAMVDHDGRRPRTWRLVDDVEMVQVAQYTVPEGLGWHQARFGPDEDQTILSMAAKGARCVDIASAIGRRRDVVKNRLIVLKSREPEAA